MTLMTELSIGDSVTCAQNAIRIEILNVMSLQTRFGYDQKCGHRNGYCLRHEKMVIDSQPGSSPFPICDECLHQARGVIPVYS